MSLKIEGVEMITTESVENDQNFQNFEGLEKSGGMGVRVRGPGAGIVAGSNAVAAHLLPAETSAHREVCRLRSELKY